MSEMSGYLKKADGTLIEIVDKAARQTVSTKANSVHTHSISDVTGLQAALDGKDTAITNEATARTNADTALQTSITNEATARENADTALQTAIDGKAASVHTHQTSDVTGLQTYVDGRITANIKRFNPNTTYAEVQSWYNSKSGEVACFVKDGVPYLFSEYNNGEYLFNHRDGSDINTASVGSDNIWTVSSVTVPTMFDIPTVDVTKSYVDTSVTAEATARVAADAALKSELDELEDTVFCEKDTSIDVSQISGITKKQSYNASTNSSGVALNELSGYDSYYFIADKEYDIYVKNITAPYYAICVGHNYSGQAPHTGYIQLLSTGATRYRNSQNNLPTESNKLHITVGDVVSFTFTSGTTDVVYGISFDKVEKVKSIYSGKYSLSNNVLDVIMNKAHYVFKKVTNTSINVDTWRLYKGDLIKPNGDYFKMWSGSDAEGVVQIKDEQDFIGGYHGDEILTNIRIFVDGKEITPSSTIVSTDFKEIAIYVESNVYHCNTSSLADTIAFKRNKYIKFSDGIVKIGNEWTAQSDMIINSAPMSLFQCYYKENGEEVAKSYMVDTDYKVYDLATPSVHTPNSKDMSVCRLETIFGSAEFKNIRTSGQRPMGVVAYNFITSQNRIKFYYYTIYGDFNITNGEKLISEFEIVVN